MRDVTRCVGSLLVSALTAAWYCKPAAGQARAAPPAAVEGRITVVMNVNRTVSTYPLRDLPVYLFKLEQSRPFEELQRKCRKAMARSGGGPSVAFAAYNVCATSLSDAVELVPRLPAGATTQTDREGFYHFDAVPSRQRYQVVAVKVEDDEPIVIVGLTPPLKPGQGVKLDLSENDPWTNADPRIN
jgi:hypothetical protein